MLDNLEYKANQSIGLTEEQRNKFKKFNLHGRYYHFQNIDSVCPRDWRLPNVQEWTSYFHFLVENNSRKIELHILDQMDPEDKNHYTSFLNYTKRIDLFKKGNPLNLNPTGRIEGDTFSKPTTYADYWSTDDKETFAGKSHIHIMNAWTTIHSHEHNMQLEKGDELRKFMVRCVKTRK